MLFFSKDKDVIDCVNVQGKISGEEEWMSLGPWGGKDGLDWAYKVDGPIMHISIGYGKAINSILFKSRNYDGIVIGSSRKIGSIDGHVVETVRPSFSLFTNPDRDVSGSIRCTWILHTSDHSGRLCVRIGALLFVSISIFFFLHKIDLYSPDK